MVHRWFTIKYTHYFYCLYNQVLGNRQGVVDDSLPVNRQGVIDDFESIFMVPWSLQRMPGNRSVASA